MPSRNRQLPGRALAVALALATLVVALPAAAQSIVIQPNFVRSSGQRDIGQKPSWVSYADCINDDVMTLTLNLANFGPYNLEAWAGVGVDCTNIDERQGASASCWRLVEPLDPTNDVVSLPIPSRAIANRENALPAGSSEICEVTADRDNVNVGIYVMLIDSSSQVQGSAIFESGIDLIGPPPPTGLSAGIGENQLIIKWSSSSTDQDLLGYRAYCDPPPGGSAPASSPTTHEDGAVHDADTDAAIDDAGTTDGGTSTDAGTTDGGTNTDGGSTDGGSGGSGGGTNAQCPSALVAGERPDETYRCGSSGRLSSSIDAEGLANNVTHAVAVAAVDIVGNSGPLSESVCGTPEIVDDFFELYRRAGGKGGGGFCQISPQTSGGLLAVMVSALAAFGLRRLGRRR